MAATLDNPPFFQALLPNRRGMDFFVGDIHGSFRKLGRELSRAGFDPAVDRLVCVGDLVDRGTDSEAAIQWLEQPFFHAVRGNHEDLYLHWRSLRGHPAEQARFQEQTYFRNGGRWVLEIPESEHQRLEMLLGRLPYFMAVAAMDGRTVGVVHAELPDGCSWPSMLRWPDREGLLRSMTWGRQRLRTARQAERGMEVEPMEDGHRIQGLDVVACGHMVVRQPTVLGNIVYLDTGGWNRRGHFSVLRMPDLFSLVDRAG